MHTQTILGAFSCRSGGQLEGGTWDESSTHTAGTAQRPEPACAEKSGWGRIRYGSEACRGCDARRPAIGRASRARMDRSFCGLPAHHVPKPENGRDKSSRTHDHDHYATHGNRVLDPLRPNKLQRPTTPPRPVVHRLQARQHNTSWTSSLSSGPPAARGSPNRQSPRTPPPRNERRALRCAAPPRFAFFSVPVRLPCRAGAVRRGAPRSRSGRTQRDILFYFIFTNITKSSIINVLDLPS